MTSTDLKTSTTHGSSSSKISTANKPDAGTPDVHGNERGDVPGWVLITLMTAGLVVAIWAIAGPALEGLFNDAIARISSR